MRLTVKINDVEGQDEQKRHILLVNEESLREALLEHKGWLAQNVVKEYLMKHDHKLLLEIIDDPVIRNDIYMQEKAKREEKAARRSQQEQHKASIATRKALNFYHDILGIKDSD